MAAFAEGVPAASEAMLAEKVLVDSVAASRKIERQG